MLVFKSCTQNAQKEARIPTDIFINDNLICGNLVFFRVINVLLFRFKTIRYSITPQFDLKRKNREIHVPQWFALGNYSDSLFGVEKRKLVHKQDVYSVARSQKWSCT